MSLYNILHGKNADSEVLLAGLGLTRNDFYRFRDVWVSEDDLIAVYTRGGGNNRECYELDYEDGTCTEDGHADSCVIVKQEKLRQHPLYVRDVDDSFDNTYCTFYFRPPDTIPADYPRSPTGDEQWAATLDALKRGADAEAGR